MDRAEQPTGNHPSTGNVAHFHKLKKPEPKAADLLMAGKHNKIPVHVTAYILKNGKFSLGCDLCEKREVFDFVTIEKWSKQKMGVVAKVVPMVQVNFVSVTLCGHKISILRADIKKLVDIAKGTLPKESKNKIPV